MTSKKLQIVCLIEILFLMLSCWKNVGAAPAENDDIHLLNQTGDAISQIVEKAASAVVSVRVEKESTTSDFSDNDELEKFFKKFFDGNDQFGEHFFQSPAPTPNQKQIIEGLGSGFVVESNGYIITNNHVVSDTDKVIVKFASGREYKAKVIGTDPPTDLAVIKIDAKDLPTLELGDSDQLKVGQWVIAIGNPFGLTSTVTVGVASAKGRSGVGIEDYEDFIQTDAAINMGNSGGPLLDTHGKVIGINTAIVSSSGGSVGIGFAIPSSMAKLVYDQLKDSGQVTRGYLGIAIQQITPNLAKYFHISNEKGILISQVEKNSPAEKAGLKQGDVIIHFNDQPADHVSLFRNYVAMQKPDSKIKLTIIRNGKEEEITATVSKMPTAAKKNVPSTEPENSIGLTVQDLTDQIAQQLGYKDLKGVVITQVQSGSPAYEAGLKSGMLITQVDQKPVTNVEEFQAQIKKDVQAGSVLLLVKNKNLSEYVVIELK